MLVVEGLIIKINDFKEHDLVLKVLTKTEIFSVLALGTRKITSKNRYALQLGSLVEFEIFKARLNNKLSKLKTAKIVFQPPLFNYDTAKIMLVILKQLNKLTLTNEELFSTIKQGWVLLGNDFNHHIKTFVIFKTLKLYGIQLVLNKCVECHRLNRINGFNFFQGGFTCVTDTKIPRSINFLHAIKYLNNDLNNFLKVKAEINQQIFAELINYLNELGSY